MSNIQVFATQDKQDWRKDSKTASQLDKQDWLNRFICCSYRSKSKSAMRNMWKNSLCAKCSIHDFVTWHNQMKTTNNIDPYVTYMNQNRTKSYNHVKLERKHFINKHQPMFQGIFKDITSTSLSHKTLTQLLIYFWQNYQSRVHPLKHWYEIEVHQTAESQQCTKFHPNCLRTF